MKIMLHEPSGGIQGETDKRGAFAFKAKGPSGGYPVTITEHVRKHAAQQAHAKRMAEERNEFVEADGEAYATASRSIEHMDCINAEKTKYGVKDPLRQKTLKERFPI